ncbi:hypothetical protein BT67DRAFT_424974 [Trichocladium antarcticum]|uniref:C2H2-type domain-containing protein n=1 Tax=Trichocladium antarcticum TaxID=1450529 RepID=A0AAN6ZCF1_9PEZI|nr:hypothetical protein BT67DRAFT_424974 [Trichocladium antarcticum]
MLSNPPHMSGLHSRQRQHRRQNSTPSAFEAVKIAPLPSFHQQHQRPSVSHRRGLSLDTRRQHLASPAATSIRQDYSPIGIPTTSRGSTPTPQHLMGETQQQRTIRPSLVQPAYTHISTQHLQNDNDSFLVSPQVTPQSQRYFNALSEQGQMAEMNGLSFETYLALDMMKSPTGFSNSGPIDPAREFEFFGPGSALSTPTFLTFPDSSPASTCQGWISENDTASTQSRRTSRRISNGIMDKIAKFEALGTGINTPSQRPSTPASQGLNDGFPQTPVESPHERLIKHEQTPLQPLNRFSDDYDESMEETIKPVRCNRPNSGVFQELRQQAEALIQTPPRANTLPVAFASQGLRTPDFMNMRNISAEFMRIQHDFDGLPTGPLDMGINPSAGKPHGPGFGPQSAFGNKPDLQPAADVGSQKAGLSFGAPSPGSGTSSRLGSPHRRTGSVASITSAASISDINIEETKTETGVTLDDIATYIQGPDPSDGKWLCLYDDCQKRFGRKENIKSHVQTHLNDRQYQCPSCHKCFVRQHDLKRHAKIHTGVKPYPCDCGNSFARHDALTRHRQRGMCIGAFDGIVRKVVKRGRPKKIRPDIDDRRDKAERTRRKNQGGTSISSASSQSEYSDSSAANSPGNEFDGLMDDDQFPGIMDVAISTIPRPAAMHPTGIAVSSAPMPTTISGSMADVFRAISPATHVPSPSALSTYSHASYASHASRAGSGPPPPSDHHRHNHHHHRHHHRCATEPPNPASPPTSLASHATHLAAAGSPPELSSTSSPPPPPPPPQQQQQQPTGAATRFFDLDPRGNCGSDAGAAGCGTVAAAGGLPGLAAAMDGDVLLQFDEAGMVQLDQNMMLGKFDKFDEDYDAVSMFTNGGDVFFGTA